MSRRVAGWLAVFGLVAAIGLVGAHGVGSSASHRTPAVDPCRAGVAGRLGDQVVRIAVDGSVRDFRLHVPSPASGRRLAVLVVFTGFLDTALHAESYTGLTALANRDGFIVAYPDPLNQEWPIYSTSEPADGDLDLVGATLDYIEAGYCVEPTRFYAAGVSNGGGEASRVACAMAGRFSGVAIVSGDYRDRPPCHPTRQVSVFDLHTLTDKVVPYLGSPSTGDGSVPGFLAQWRAIDGCSMAGTRARLDANTTGIRWTCRDQTVIQQYELARGGHIWPGSTPNATAVPGPRSAAAKIWAFFDSLAPRPG